MAKLKVSVECRAHGRKSTGKFETAKRTKEKQMSFLYLLHFPAVLFQYRGLPIIKLRKRNFHFENCRA